MLNVNKVVVTRKNIVEKAKDLLMLIKVMESTHIQKIAITQTGHNKKINDYLL